MTDADRSLILSTVAASPEDKVIITHGTDSMVNTSIVLGENINNKTVVLLGAMVPYNEPNSDASFNMGFAVAAVQLLPYGVYICMQGTVFNWYNVQKNRSVEPPRF